MISAERADAISPQPRDSRVATCSRLFHGVFHGFLGGFRISRFFSHQAPQKQVFSSVFGLPLKKKRGVGVSWAWAGIGEVELAGCLSLSLKLGSSAGGHNWKAEAAAASSAPQDEGEELPAAHRCCQGTRGAVSPVWHLEAGEGGRGRDCKHAAAACPSGFVLGS
jgi:hypothetical protein